MRLPEWIKTDYSGQHSMKNLMRAKRLTTVCEEARCPNRGYCFSKPTAAFMILGDACTRDCGFCAVAHGAPNAPDKEEPQRVAEAVFEMGLKFVVITSVTRDDLQDGGAGHFAATIKTVRKRCPEVKIEVLTPDFNGSEAALQKVLDARPDVFNHNIETVRRLYRKARPQADYERSLEIIKTAKQLAPDIKTKSGFMVGLGETRDEISGLLRDLRTVNCDFLTVGQYLRPAKKNLAVVEYIKPDVFESIRKEALSLGFGFVASGPLVRSSMNAEEMYEGGLKNV
ncbi:MAG: lipoyl synthase [Nitrospirae bacterium]|nr:MAG: lipoyl synthase [Nitrospirota bacterium]